MAVNVAYNTGKLDRDIGCLVLSDTEEYWGYGLLSDPHPSNLVSTVLYRYDPVPTVHDKDIHDLRIKCLEDLLNNGCNDLRVAKEKLTNIHKEEVMSTLSKRSVHKKMMLNFAMSIYMDGYKGGDPILKLRCPTLWERVVDSKDGTALLELHTAGWIWRYVDGYHLWACGPGEFVDRPSAVVDLLLQFE